MSLRPKLNRPITKISNLVRITEEEEQQTITSNNMWGPEGPRARPETLTNLAFQVWLPSVMLALSHRSLRASTMTNNRPFSSQSSKSFPQTPLGTINRSSSRARSQGWPRRRPAQSTCRTFLRNRTRSWSNSFFKRSVKSCLRSWSISTATTSFRNYWGAAPSSNVCESSTASKMTLSLSAAINRALTRFRQSLIMWPCRKKKLLLSRPCKAMCATYQ